MKKIVFAIICAAIFAASCQKEPEIIEDPQLDVTFTNISGDWVLTDWKGHDMSTVKVFIRLKNRKLTMWQSVGSMYPVLYTGEYNLYEELGKGVVIRGKYDYTDEFWDHRYTITSLTAKEMEWTSLDDPEDVSIYTRTEFFPDEI